MTFLKQLQTPGLLLALLLTTHLSYGQNTVLNDNLLLLRNPIDTQNGLGYFGPARLWGSFNVDGPVLFGFTGGILGTNASGTPVTALYWNSVGNVGIGTTAPTKKLEVVGDTKLGGNVQITGVLNAQAGGSYTSMLVDYLGTNSGSFNDNTTAGTGLVFGGAFGTGGAGIASKGNVGGNRNGLDFYTTALNRMSITSEGKVGISTTAPTASLDVNGSTRLRGLTTAGVVMTDANGNLSSSSAALAGSTIQNQSASVQTANFNISGSGYVASNVGIGTTAPTAILDVNGSTRLRGLTTAGIVMTDASGNLSSGTTLAASAIQNQNASTQTANFNISGSGYVAGNVCIGTTGTPRGKLDVANGDTYLVTDPDNGSNQTVYLPGHLMLAPYSGTSGTAYIQARVKNPTATTNLSLNFRVTNAGTLLDAFKLNADATALFAGNVGIGTTAPTAALDVNGGILARAYGAISNQGAHLQWNRSGSDGETWLLNQKGIGATNAGIRFGSATMANVVTEWARFLDNGNFGIGTTAPAARLDVAGTTRLNGNVLIGSNITKFTSPTPGMNTKMGTYGLWVEKGVVANDFAIAGPATWADFVFAPGYRLPSLADTEHYIRQHGHLPEMPSAADVKKDGYSVHEMNTRLLQKIEELTLHSIEQEKQIQQLTALQAQLRQVETLATEVARLKVLLEK